MATSYNSDRRERLNPLWLGGLLLMVLAVVGLVMVVLWVV